MNSVSSLIQQSNPYEKFVQQLVEIESQQKYKLQVRQEGFNDQKSALGKVSSVISEFTSKIDELTSSTKNNSNPLKASTSNEEVIRIDSTSGMDQSNTYDVSIDRKASKDIMLSTVMDGAGTNLANNGDGNIEVKVGDQTKTIAVTTTNKDGTTKTNEEMLQSFSDSLSEMMGKEIDSDVFQIDNKGKVQLSIKSAKTGSANKIEILSTSGAGTDIAGSMSHQQTDPTKLDAQFTIDGITFTRGQNTVDDAISGMTFTLLDTSSTGEQITIDKDTEKARGNIDGFIEKFNKMNKKIRSQTFLNGETGNKGPLQGMRSIRNLSLNLRQTALRDMASAAPGKLDNLTDIGIGFEKDGKMKIEDEELLKKALSEKPDEVNNLFSADDSPIQAMYDRAKSYTDSGGVISTLESGLEQKIDFLDNRIESENDYLKRYEERQRQIFAEIQQIQTQGQLQLNSLQSQQASLGL